MPFALLLALIAITSCTLLTYLYDREATLVARLSAGICTGFAALGLIGFVLASVMGLTPLALLLSGLILSVPLALLLRPEWRARLSADVEVLTRSLRRALLHPGSGMTASLVFYLLVMLMFWFVFERAMYQNAGGIFTGVDNNLGDLPLHVAIINGFVYGDNFPPQHPEFAATRLTYPFMVDFVAAMFVRAGASLEGAIFWQNMALAFSLVGLLYRWALKLTRDVLAAHLVPVLMLLGGGFGWTYFLKDWRESRRGFFDVLMNLPNDYTISLDGMYRWGNMISTLLVPQRGILFGIPLALLVMTLWWQATEQAEEEGEAKLPEAERERPGAERDERPREKRSRSAKKAKRWTADSTTAENVAHASSASAAFLSLPVNASSASPLSHFFASPAMRRMVAAGVVAGLLPLAHAHSFIVLMGMGGCLALLWAVRRGVASGAGFTGGALMESLRPWAAFFVVALVLAVPQMFWATRQSGVQTQSFIGIEVGWDNRGQNVFWFWIKNTGLFIPLLIAALLWRGQRPVVRTRLFYFYLPFVLCFIGPNLVKLSPWVWDNIKVLIYWFIASTPLVALLLARLWRKGVAWRAPALALLLVLSLAGGLDVWRIMSRATERVLFDRDAVAFAELIQRETPPRSLILHAPTYNDPVYLAGRRTYMGYPGHLWTHGIDYAAREAELKRIYTGAPDAAELLTKNGIEYVVVGPLERDEMTQRNLTLNESFFAGYTQAGKAGAYQLYKTTRR